MNGTAKRITIAVLFLLVVTGLGVYVALDWVIEAGYEPCALSIESALGKALNDDTVKSKIHVSNEWRILDEQEERYALDNVVKPNPHLDCHQFPQYADGSIFQSDGGHIKVKLDGSRILVRIETNDGHARRPD